jgi:hypothetical protein
MYRGVSRLSLFLYTHTYIYIHTYICMYICIYIIYIYLIYKLIYIAQSWRGAASCCQNASLSLALSLYKLIYI